MTHPGGPERRRVPGFRLTAKYQVSGWRFLFRRLQHALVRRDTRMIDDPQRAQAGPLALGVVIAVVVCVGAVVWSLFSPAGLVKDAKIVADATTGALYVRIGDRLDPVTNLTSARLIVGAPEMPLRASSAEIDRYPHGSLVGIVGAPVDIRSATDPRSVWTVCDATFTGTAVPLDPVSGLPTTARAPVTTTAMGGPLATSPDTVALGGDRARLVDRDGRTWLVYARADGVVVRSVVDLSDPTVSDALGLSADAAVLPVSAGLFNALPAEPPLVPPTITGAGERPRFPTARPLTVGTVVTVRDLDGRPAYHVTLADGMAPVGLVAATMIRAAYPQASTGPLEAAPDEIAGYPTSDRLAVDAYPPRPLRLVDPDAQPVTCWSWSHVGDEPTARTEVLVGRTLPLTPQRIAAAVALIGAPTSQGQTADAVSMPSTTGRFVQVTGSATDSRLRESYFWLADNGVRFGLDTTDEQSGDSTLAALGLRDPVPAPWTVVSLFAPGPTLSHRDAAIRHDGVASNPVVAAFDPRGTP